MPDQFSSARKRLNQRRDRLNNVSRLLSSTKKSDRQQAQRILKSIGRYSGPIDGSQGKGTTAALKAMRQSIDVDSSNLGLRVKQFNKNAAQQRSDKLAANKQKTKAAKQKADAEARKSLIQTGVLATSVVGGLAYSAKSVKNLRKQDAVSVKAINSELKRVNTKLEQTKKAKGAKLKTGQYSTATKKRLAAIANSAKGQGLTKYRMPIGGSKAIILAAESIGARILAETAFKDNEMAKQTLHGVSTGLGIAALTTPLTRVADKHATPHRLNAGHVTAIDEAASMGNARSKKLAKKTLKSSAIKGVKSAGKKALKAIPIVGYAATAYFAGDAAYRAFNKTGSVAKAATAGGDELTFGAVSSVKKELSRPKAEKKALQNKLVKRLRASNTRSVQGLLNASKRRAKATSKTPVRITPLKVSHISNGKVRAHTRTINGKRVRVKSFKRKAA